MAKADKTTRLGKTKVTALDIGSAQIIESELEQLDGVTPGTVAVNKCIVPTTGKVIDELDVTTLKKGGTAITATAAEINSGRGAGVKRYVALVKQSGTAAPTAVVLENSLGGTVVFTRNGVGNYTATLAGAFPEDKVAVLTSQPNAAHQRVTYEFATVNTLILRTETVTSIAEVIGTAPADSVMDQDSGITLTITVYP